MLGFWGLEPLPERRMVMENRAVTDQETKHEGEEKQRGQSDFEESLSRVGPLLLMLVIGIVMGYMTGSSGYSEMEQKLKQDEVASGLISKGYQGVGIIPRQVIRSQDPLFADGEEKWPAGSLVIFVQKGNDLIITPKGEVEVYKPE